VWKERVAKVVSMQEFHNGKDFEVTLMTFLNDPFLPDKADNTTDYSFFSHDCFHFSQKGHSALAVNLWNQMLTSANERSDVPSYDNTQVKCPSQRHPFFRTYKN
jgi:phospholipase B1